MQVEVGKKPVKKLGSRTRYGSKAQSSLQERDGITGHSTTVNAGESRAEACKKVRE